MYCVKCKIRAENETLIRDALHTLLMCPYDRCLLNWTNGGAGALGLCQSSTKLRPEATLSLNYCPFVTAVQKQRWRWSLLGSREK